MVSKIECEWKLLEFQIMVAIKQKETEELLKLDEEKSKLKVMEADMTVKMAAAQVDVYSSLEEGTEVEFEGENLDLNPNVKLV